MKIIGEKINGTRKRVVFAGSNDGWVHGFNAGEFQTLPTPKYDRGTGEETFGFMPWPVRQAAREIPRDTGARDFYGVDGSPSVADAWIDADGNEVKASDGSEWRTVLLGGLRQGGPSVVLIDQLLEQVEGDPVALLRNQFRLEEQRMMSEQGGRLYEPRPW